MNKPKSTEKDFIEKIANIIKQDMATVDFSMDKKQALQASLRKKAEEKVLSGSLFANIVGTVKKSPRWMWIGFGSLVPALLVLMVWVVAGNDGANKIGLENNIEKDYPSQVALLTETKPGKKEVETNMATDEVAAPASLQRERQKAFRGTPSRKEASAPPQEEALSVDQRENNATYLVALDEVVASPSEPESKRPPINKSQVERLVRTNFGGRCALSDCKWHFIWDYIDKDNIRIETIVEFVPGGTETIKKMRLILDARYDDTSKKWIISDKKSTKVEWVCVGEFFFHPELCRELTNLERR